MSIEDKLMTVKLAEVDCEAATVRARDTWSRLNATFKEAATPWRIVTIGAVSGFLMGRQVSDGSASLGGKLFATAAQAVITAMGASAASGAAADAAAKSAADASASATSGAIQDEAVRTGVIADA